MGELLDALYFATAAVLWLGMVYYMFRTASLRKPEDEVLGKTTFWTLKPFAKSVNVILMLSKLTEAGLRARKKFFVLFLTFFALILVRLLYDSIAAQVKLS